MDRFAAESILRAWPKIEFVCDDWDRMRAAVKIRCVRPAIVHRNMAVESIIDRGRTEALAVSGSKESRPNPLKRPAHIAGTIMRMLFS